VIAKELPARQQQLYDLLAGRGDVMIADIYKAMKGPRERKDDLRYQQQWLGKYITLLNRNLVERDLKVRPAQTKGAYCIVILPRKRRK
jgi:hypothetical protein